MRSSSPELKVLGIYHALKGKTLQEIQGLSNCKISCQSLNWWLELYNWSNAVVRGPDAMCRLRVRQLDKAHVKLIGMLNAEPKARPIDIINWACVSHSLTYELADLVHSKLGKAQWRQFNFLPFTALKCLLTFKMYLTNSLCRACSQSSLLSGSRRWTGNQMGNSYLSSKPASNISAGLWRSIFWSDLLQKDWSTSKTDTSVSFYPL